MTTVFRRRRTAWIATLTMLALAWHALAPLAAATMQPPRATTTLCTSLGVRVIMVDDDQALADRSTVDHCPLCRLAAAGDSPLPVGGWQVDRAMGAAQCVPFATTAAAFSDPWSPGSPRAPPAN